ncbi:MAG TPA: AAA family ATPase [Polyangiaceae bacterium]
MAAGDGQRVHADEAQDAPGRDAARDLPAGALIAGRYRVLSSLGTGGMGTVYRVFDEPTERTLALKQLRTSKPKHRERGPLLFRREFHTLATLRHPRIVEAFDFGVDPTGLYYTMELLEGQDLRDLPPLPAPAACLLLRDVASALAFLHARRLVHRDVSPRNVRCTATGEAKLIDFGVLATAGLVGEIAGTPPCVPPESMELSPLDHRADLYGIGALGYWLLTGRHAFSARTFAELPEQWLIAPAPPSAYARDVPEALDRLISSLLRRDPVARPASAAEVIERLGAIAGTPRVPELETARGYLASGALVGRSEEMGEIRRAAEGIAKKRGRALLIEGPSGMGKSRLLREIALESQIAGLTVLRAEGDAAGRGPWGVLRKLTAELLVAAPELAGLLARPHLAVIGRAIPELIEHAGAVPLAALSADPREERAQVQSSLVSWFVALAKRRPLAIIVDDVQRSDEGSASVLAALSHEAHARKWLVATAMRTDEAPRAPAALASLRDAAQSVPLRGLTRSDVEEFARAVFGDVPNLARLSSWLHATTAGVPLLCAELCRHLVERDVVRYTEGLWVVPAKIENADAPHSLAEAMDARARALSAEARELGQALSVHGRLFSLRRATELAPGKSAEQVFQALDELVAQEILLGSGDAYQFRHDGLREALLRSIEPEQRRALHRHIGEVLVAAGPIDPDAEADVGWHLLRGGDEERGAELLERAGRRLYAAQSLHDAAPPLEAALLIYERTGRTAAVCLELRFMLVCAGFLCDRNLTLRYADETLDALRRYAGITASQRFDRWGSHAGLALGFLDAGAGWLGTLRDGARPNPASAFHMYVIASTFTAAVALASFDLPLLNRLVRQMEPLGTLRRVPFLRVFELQIRSLRDVWLARFESADHASRQVLRDLPRTRMIPEETVKLARGGALFVRALSNLMDNASPEVLQHIAALEHLGVKTWRVGATQLRLLHHALRGEEERAQEMHGAAEELLLQTGASWQMEVWVPPALTYAYSQVRDVIGMKRTIEQIARLQAAGLPFERVADWARSEYCRERRDLQQALRANQLARAAGTEVDMVYCPILACRADILLAMCDYDGARDAALECLRVLREPGRRRLGLIARATRTLALAGARTGKVDEALHQLQKVLDEAGPAQNPVLIGGLHETAARVAVLGRDTPRYLHHCHHTERWYRPTKNPVLVGRYERLVDSAQALDRTSREGRPHWEERVTQHAVTQIDGTT